jgi:two-component system, OmpR family, sensor kinase
VLFGWFVVIAILAYAATRLLYREAVRPLDEVVAALEAFGAGDLTLRPVDAAAKDDFGRLALAYNGAVRQMTAAFAERDRAEAETRRFIADGAHQLRTPLTVIQGFIGILIKNDPHAAGDRERILWTMDRQSRAMSATIQKLTLLDHWEASASNPQLTDVGECISEIVVPLAASRRNEDVSFSQIPACYAFVDALEIREAVGNVLDNALKYGAGAPVAVRVDAAERDVSIVVTDQGPGMSADDQRNAFRRFYRGEHREIAGSGLGLAIAKRAVERAGGAISIASAPGTGTAVTITLPRRTV